MRGVEFTQLVAFSEIAERASFAKAAAKLGVSASALSQSMKQLEARLGVRLLHRTTRQVVVTAEGEELLAAVRSAVTTLDRATEGVLARRGGAAGIVRVTTSRVGAETLILPRLAAFRAEFPDIRLEISMNNRFVDLSAERFDVGIRRREFVPRDAVARRIAPDEPFVCVASEDYLARAGEPRRPADLARHDCVRLRMRKSGGTSPWRFVVGARRIEQKVEGSLVVDDARFALSAAIDGVGIAYLAEGFVLPSVAARSLRVLLRPWAATRSGYVAFHAAGVSADASGRTFVRFLERFAGTPPTR